MWASKAETDSSGYGWISSAASTALNHLRTCRLVSEDVRSTADESRAHKYPPNSPTSHRRRRQHEPVMNVPLPSINFHSPDPASIAGPSTLELPSVGLHYESGQSSEPPSPWISSHHSSDRSESEFSAFSHSRPLSRSQSFSVLRRSPLNSADSGFQWSKEKQKSFENRIARLTASAGFPLSWVDNAEWIDFCTEFLPAAKLPSRKTLTRRLLPAAVEALRASARAAAKGHEATLQADGWTGTNNHHLLAFMITANGQVWMH